MNTLKVATYNIGFGAGLEGLQGKRVNKEVVLSNLNSICDTLASENLDVLCVQEIDISSYRSHFIDQVSFIKTKFGFSHVSICNVWKKWWVPYPATLKIWHQFGFVNAAQVVFSKHPIVTKSITKLCRRLDKGSLYNFFYIKRKIQDVGILVNDSLVHILNVHLEAFDKNTRDTQMKSLSDYLNKLSTPFIVMGDFNTIPENEKNREFDSKYLKEDFTEDRAITLLTKYKSSNDCLTDYTFPSDVPLCRLDHIFLSEQFHFKNVIVKNTLASDHLPVVALIKLV